MIFSGTTIPKGLNSFTFRRGRYRTQYLDSDFIKPALKLVKLPSRINIKNRTDLLLYSNRTSGMEWICPQESAFSPNGHTQQETKLLVDQYSNAARASAFAASLRELVSEVRSGQLLSEAMNLGHSATGVLFTSPVTELAQSPRGINLAALLVGEKKDSSQTELPRFAAKFIFAEADVALEDQMVAYSDDLGRLSLFLLTKNVPLNLL